MLHVVCEVKQSATATSLSIIIDSQSCASKSSKKKLAIIVGATVGGFIVLVVIAIVLIYVFRKKIPFFKHARGRGASRNRSDFL